MHSTKLEAFLPAGARKNIDDGTWCFMGVTLQDRASGRIVASLKAVEKQPDTDYTPALFVAVQNEICLSQELILARVSEEFRRLRSTLSDGFSQIESKLDFQTDIAMAQIIGEINHFFSQFEHLKSGDRRRADMMLQDGGRLAARLAGMTDVLIRDYLGEVRLTGRSNTMTYREYLALPAGDWFRNWGEITQLVYPDLMKSRVKQFIPALTEILNRLNIISVCFYHELYMDYQDTLLALRSQLLLLLDQLVNGVPVNKRNFDDYAQRVFGRDENGRWIQDNDADRLEKYFDAFSRNHLATRSFHPVTRTEADRDLVCSVKLVLDMIDSTDMLLLRGEELERGALRDTESVALLRESTFPSRQTRPALAPGE